MAKICPDCGSENADVAQFCKGCGKQLDVPVIKAEEKPKKERKTREKPERKPRKERKPKGEKKDYIGDFKEKWSTWSTGKKAGVGIAGACCVLLIVFFLISAFISPDANLAPVENETYQFDGFTLDFPTNVSMYNYTTNDESDYNSVTTYVNWNDENDSPHSVEVITMKGSSLVSSEDEYFSNVQRYGAEKVGTYGEWTIVDMRNLTGDNGESVDEGYVLVHHTGDRLVGLSGDDLELLKKVSDTFKKA